MISRQQREGLSALRVCDGADVCSITALRHTHVTDANDVGDATVRRAR